MKYCLRKNTTPIAPNILGIMSGNGVLTHPILSNTRNEAIVDMQLGIIIVASSTENMKFLPRNLSFANENALIADISSPTTSPGT